MSNKAGKSEKEKAGVTNPRKPASIHSWRKARVPNLHAVKPHFIGLSPDFQFVP
ncbi:hypothetical protein [Thermoactinomyces mirandus]|uniref:Uncharacterized protein n=1 Tax=Thermoactinomyces mirandus TaxID=2756294 RepID=A0A7W1XS13_9BACL|nr:hypothetical protein [Thermoactinomyces mirandus]MBA4602233.1 hypothetical protein [Thermoactinomyces mirandus]